MIQRVWESAKTAQFLDKVIIATDDERIAGVCRRFGAEVVMTVSELPSGTDRIAEAYRLYEREFDVVVNIQGDEPLLRGEIIDDLLSALVAQPKADVATPVKKITEAEDLTNPSVVKVVLGSHRQALYFSRNPIPHIRDSSAYVEWVQLHSFWKHIGIYAYRTATLLQFQQLPVSHLEQAEQLEQLRLLEAGAQFICVETPHTLIAIDTPADLEHVLRFMKHSHIHFYPAQQP